MNKHENSDEKYLLRCEICDTYLKDGHEANWHKARTGHNSFEIFFEGIYKDKVRREPPVLEIEHTV